MEPGDAPNFRELRSPLTPPMLRALDKRVERIQMGQPLAAQDLEAAAGFIARHPDTIVRLYEDGSKRWTLESLGAFQGLRRLELDFTDDAFLDFSALDVLPPGMVELWLPVTKKPKKNVDALARFTKLEVLSLCGKVDDLSVLAKLPTLKRLTLHKLALADLEPLAACTNLERLRIGATQLESLRGIERLSKLRTLELADVKGLEGVEPAAACPALENLELTILALAKPVASLAGFKALRHLIVNDVRPELTLDTAWTAPALKSIDVHAERDFKERELRALPAHPSLERAFLGYLGKEERERASEWVRVRVHGDPKRI